MKKDSNDGRQKPDVDSLGNQEELVPPPTPEPDVDPEEDLDLSAGEEDRPAEKNGDTSRLVLLSFTLSSWRQKRQEVHVPNVTFN